MTSRTAFILISAAGLWAPAAEAATQGVEPEPHPGGGVFQERCAVCHGGADPRAPALETLRAMNADDLRHALTEGLMAVQGSTLSPEERAAVLEFLAAPRMPEEVWITGMSCVPNERTVDLGRPVSMGRVGVDLTGSRFLTADAAGLSAEDMAELELAWAIAFPGVTGLRAAPVILGGTLFYSAGATRKLLALDTETGCVKWVYDSPTPLRSSLALGDIRSDGRRALYFGDARGQVHAVDAATGEGLWVANAQADPGTGGITGSLVVHDGKLIVPISASGVTAAANPEHQCCVGRGAVTVLDAESGDRVWVYRTMEEPSPGFRSSAAVPAL